jgi:ABC-type cobalt transport system substrate-binding protein
MDDSDEDVIDEAKTQKAAQFGWFNDLYSFDTGNIQHLIFEHKNNS